MAVTINGSTGVDYADNIKQKFGTGDDLEIYHDGSDNFIKNAVAGKHLKIQDADGDDMAIFYQGSSVNLYHDGSKKFETNSAGVKIHGICYFDDNNSARFGDGDDLQISFNGTNGWIDCNAGSLYIDTTADIIARVNDTEDAIKAIANGAVELYYNNSKKLETFGEGITLNGGASSCEIKMLSDGSLRGYVYINNNASMGFLKSDGNWRFEVENDGDYTFYGNNVSDRDRKDNITTVTGTSLDKITKLVPKTYNWKATDDGKTPTDRTFTGFIAQEVKEHLPSLVTGTDGQKNMAIDYNGILAHAVKAITELSAEVDTLKAKVAALEGG